MRKRFAHNPTTASCTQTSAPAYCCIHTTTTPVNKVYAGKNAKRSNAMFFLLSLNCKQKQFQKSSRDGPAMNITTDHSLVPIYHYRLNPSSNTNFLLYETTTTEKIRNVCNINDDCEFVFCK